MAETDDRAQVRRLLANAPGYAVFDRSGKRIGDFIEVRGDGADRIAIRKVGTFVWRRRLLPVASVAKVLPDQRAVVLALDRQALGGTDGMPAGGPSASVIAQDDPPDGREWQDPVERYVAVGEGQAVQAETQRAGPELEASPTPDEGERPATPGDGQQLFEARREQRAIDGHLIFVSTPRGYALLEREGSPPPLGSQIELPEQPGRFRVVKLAPSPLPSDQRTCAYLEQAS